MTTWLCLKGENSNKANLTPHEWFQATNVDGWPEFVARVAVCKELRKRKRRFLLLQNAREVEAGFMKRSLADGQTAARLVKSSVLEFLQQRFPDAHPLPEIVARPARLVSWLRNGWQLDHIKHPNGKRTSDDRQHAVDALIVAAMDARTLNSAIKCAQRNEATGRPRFEFSLQEPWPTFAKDVERAIEGIGLIARAVNSDFKGRLHGDTTYALENDGTSKRKVERVPIDRLRVDEKRNIDDLERIKDAERNRKLVEELREWIKKGKPKDSLPKWKYRWPDGTETKEPIRKVSLLTNEGPAFTPARVRRANGTGFEEVFATFDRADMIRVDVFQKKNDRGKWQFFMVPIYPHQIASMDTPPDQAVMAYEPESEWPRMDDSFEFLWSLQPMDYIELVKANGLIIEGYFRGLDRSTGAIGVSLHQDNTAISKGIGTRTLTSFRKFAVDRLGRKFEIGREQRTWRGKTINPIAPRPSDSVAYSVSSVHGVEGSAPDAAE